MRDAQRPGRRAHLAGVAPGDQAGRQGPQIDQEDAAEDEEAHRPALSRARAFAAQAAFRPSPGSSAAAEEKASDSGEYTLEELEREAGRWGLTSKSGKPVRKSSLAHLLRNPFYYGVMKFKGELFEASHPPLVSKKLFDRVQEVLEHKAKPMKHGEIKFAGIKGENRGI